MIGGTRKNFKEHWVENRQGQRLRTGFKFYEQIMQKIMEYNLSMMYTAVIFLYTIEEQLLTTINWRGIPKKNFKKYWAGNRWVKCVWTLWSKQLEKSLSNFIKKFMTMQTFLRSYPNGWKSRGLKYLCL